MEPALGPGAEVGRCLLGASGENSSARPALEAPKAPSAPQCVGRPCAGTEARCPLPGHTGLTSPETTEPGSQWGVTHGAQKQGAPAAEGSLLGPVSPPRPSTQGVLSPTLGCQEPVPLREGSLREGRGIFQRLPH